MPQITVTLDLTRETINALHVLVDALNKKPIVNGDEVLKGQISFDDLAEKPEAPVSKKPGRTKEKPAEDLNLYGVAPTVPDEMPAKENTVSKISLTEVRAVALKLSKAGKQKELKAIFAKYGAEKLSDISSDNYRALMADLEAIDG